MRSLLFLLLFVWAAHAQEIAIDWDKAQGLHERALRGEKLSTDERQYYDEARRQLASRAALPPQRRRGGWVPTTRPPPPPDNLVPLTELRGSYHDQDGGLYGGGRNEPPAELTTRAARAAQGIMPLNAAGRPAADGHIVLMSIGMSNTTQSFSTFKRLADADPRKSGKVTIVDAAQGARTAGAWAAYEQPWEEAARRLEAAQITPAQVQVLWIKQANPGPTDGWPAATNRLRDDIRQIIVKAREKYPNVRLVFLSSRTYAGYATTPLNPEPYAYESAFAVRALIREQSSDGAILLWGPYLWTNGEKGRALDDLKWTREDVVSDGTHPSHPGQAKVAQLLLDFFTKNPYAKPWFTAP